MKNAAELWERLGGVFLSTLCRGEAKRASTVDNALKRRRVKTLKTRRLSAERRFEFAEFRERFRRQLFAVAKSGAVRLVEFVGGEAVGERGGRVAFFEVSAGPFEEAFGQRGEVVGRPTVDEETSFRAVARMTATAAIAAAAIIPNFIRRTPLL